MAQVGFTLPPDLETLERLGALIEQEPDYYELAPETLWRTHADGSLESNGFHRRFLELGRRTGRPFVAHGVGLSPGTASAKDAPRRRRWLERLRRDQAEFGFLWYTDHLGATAPDGLALGLPLPLPMTAHAAALVRRRLRSMRRVVPDVGLETTASYFLLGAPLDEPRFLNRIARGEFWVLLDLHNVHTMATNLGFDPREYLARLDLGRVIEIHVSGGSPSDPRWLPSGRSLWLDGHDDAVPEAVWSLLEATAPRCPNLRGVTLERMEGTVERGGAAALRDELRRVRTLLRGAR